MVRRSYRKLFFHTLSSTNSFHYLTFLIGKRRCYATFFYVSPLFVINFLPNDYSAHFLLYYTFVKVLYFFTDEKQLLNIDNLFSLYHESLSRLYSKRSELATVHYHTHLLSQVFSHGALCFTSCFSRESYFAQVLNWCKGTTHVLNQMVIWYNISQNIHKSGSVSVSDIFSKESFSPTFLDKNFIATVQYDFVLSLKSFHASPDRKCTRLNPVTVKSRMPSSA